MYSFKLNYLFLFIFFISCSDSTSTKIVPSSTEFKPAATLTKTQRKFGQHVYVPIYSSIHHEGNLFQLTATLSIRNISHTEAVIISEVTYYDTNGKLLKQFIPHPFSLGKMASKDFVISMADLSGGTGANFVVKWESDKPVAVPIIEAVMVGSQGTKGFSFVSRGKEIEIY